MSCSLRCDISALHSVRFHAVVCETEDVLLEGHPVLTNAPQCMVHTHHGALARAVLSQDCMNKTQSNHMLRMGQAMSNAAGLERLEASYI